MAMSYILAAFFVLALVCGGISGRMAEVSAAAMEVNFKSNFSDNLM